MEKISKTSILYDPKTEKNFNWKQFFKRLKKGVLIGLLVSFLGGTSFYLLSNYIGGLKSEVASEKSFHSRNTRDLKAYTSEIKELETEIEEVKWDRDLAVIEGNKAILEIESSMTDAQLLFDSKLSSSETKRNSLIKEKDNLQTELWELEKQLRDIKNGYTYKASIESVLYDVSSDYEKSITIKLSESDEIGHVNDIFIHESKGRIWCYMSANISNDYTVLLRFLLDGDDLDQKYQVLHTGNRAYGHFQMIGNQLGFITDYEVSYIDLDTGIYQYTISYDQYKEFVVANNGAKLYVDHDNVLYYEFDGEVKQIYYGYNECDVNRGGGLVFVPMELHVSNDGEFFSYSIGYYEGCSGPFVLDKYGDLVYKSRYEWDVWGYFINDHDFVMNSYHYEGQYIDIIDLDEYSRTRVLEGEYNMDYSIIESFDNSLVVGIYDYDERSSEIRIFNEDYSQYSHMTDIEELDRYSMKIYDNKIMSWENNNGSLIMSINDYVPSGQSDNNIETYPFVNLEGYDHVTGQLFFSQSQFNEDGSPSLYYLAPNGDNIYNIDALDELEEYSNYKSPEIIYYSDTAIFDNRIMINSYTGSVMMEDLIDKALGNKDKTIISSDVYSGYSNGYCFITMTNINDMVEINVLVSDKAINDEEVRELILIDSFTLPLSEFDHNDWKIAFSGQDEVLFDSFDQEVRVIKEYTFGNSNAEIFLSNVKNPTKVSYTGTYAVENLDSGQFNIVNKYGSVLKTFDYKPLRVINSSNSYYFVVDGELIITSGTGNVIHRTSLKNKEIIEIVDYERMTFIKYIEWLPNGEFKVYSEFVEF